jgi:hypothetical protein
MEPLSSGKEPSSSCGGTAVLAADSGAAAPASVSGGAATPPEDDDEASHCSSPCHTYYAEEDLVEEVSSLAEERWVCEDPAVTATIFEEEDQEMEYHRRRSLVLPKLVQGFRAVRRDFDQMQKASESLLEEFERLQSEYTGAVSEVAYWKTLAEEIIATAGDDASPTSRKTVRAGGA